MKDESVPLNKTNNLNGTAQQIYPVLWAGITLELESLFMRYLALLIGIPACLGVGYFVYQEA